MLFGTNFVAAIFGGRGDTIVDMIQSGPRHARTTDLVVIKSRRGAPVDKRPPSLPEKRQKGQIF